MPYYSPDLIQQVLDANDIVDVISQYVPLKPRGNRYVACCPFHQEKTPSFTVDRDKNYYYCFGCHEGGNLYNFLEKKENMSFPEALEFLADRANITLPKSNNKEDLEKIQEKQHIYNINAKAGNYFYNNLKKSRKALGYLVDRGIPHDIIFEFGLGYSNDDWADLFNFMTESKEDSELLKKAGLIRTSKGRNYDVFRDRLIIPIQNVFNKVIAFGGRKFNDIDPGPKYINTPDTPVFNKKRELFNLNRAKSCIRTEPLILVEGYMDVIALYSYGIQNTAAALGTAFTPDHVKLISRYTDSVILCFDGDLAGEKATNKAIDLLSNSSLKVQIVRLPVEHDPDSFIRENGLEAFKELLTNADSIIDYKLKQLKSKFDLSRSNELIDFIMACCLILKDLNPVEQEIYTQKVSEISGIEINVIKEQLGKLKSQPKTKNVPPIIKHDIPKSKPSQSRARRVPKELVEAQNIYLSYCLKHPEFIISSKITEEMLVGKFYKWLFRHIKDSDLNNLTLEEIDKNNHDYLEKYLQFKNSSKESNYSIASQAIEVIKKYYRQLEVSKLEAALKNDDKENQQNLFDKILNLKKADWVNQ